MQIDNIPEMALTAAQEAEIGALMDACFDTEFAGRSFFMQRHHLRITAREGDVLVGHLALLYRDIRQGDRHFPIVGLAEVATHPAHRGKGIAGTLLQEAITAAGATRAHFLVLFGTARLYAAAGFAAQPNRLRFASLHDVRTGEVKKGRHDGLMVLPLTDEPWDAVTPVDLVGHKF